MAGEISFDHAAVLSAIQDEVADYVEHHDPEQHHDRVPDRDLDPTVEKLLKLNPGLSIEDAMHMGFKLGFSVGARVALEQQDGGPHE